MTDPAGRTSAPPGLDLGRLFRRWPDLETPRDWEKAGFEVVDDGKLLVLGHPSAAGYLFKIYSSEADLSAREQFKKYQRRVAGAALLRDHVARANLQRVAVPKKWLCALPGSSSSRKRSPHVVVVERQALVGERENDRQYRKIDEATVRELCTIMFSFRGLDLTRDNAAFTRGGKIAFIDTEYLKTASIKLRSRRRYFAKCVDKLLPDHWRVADDAWDALVKTVALR